MTDIDSEKVVKGLKSCSEVDCTECQYGTEGHGHNDCIERLCADTLDLIKEQKKAMKAKDGTITGLIDQIKYISKGYKQVILCKDCKNWHINYVPIGEKHGCDVMRDYTPPDGYCFKAVKRDV